MSLTLDMLEIDDFGIVEKINTDASTRDRLESLGIIKGEKIMPVFVTPLKSPIIYQCLNTLIALRPDITSKIEIRRAGA
ncbi:MAG TPA: FeoA family protein [Patescibacteria group bacterium]|nr:FeoA family protein [Patescibacteria group bacterium]